MRKSKPAVLDEPGRRIARLLAKVLHDSRKRARSQEEFHELVKQFFREVMIGLVELGDRDLSGARSLLEGAVDSLIASMDEELQGIEAEGLRRLADAELQRIIADGGIVEGRPRRITIRRCLSECCALWARLRAGGPR